MHFHHILLFGFIGVSFLLGGLDGEGKEGEYFATARGAGMALGYLEVCISCGGSAAAAVFGRR